MALPKPDEILKKNSASGSLPTPDAVLKPLEAKKNEQTVKEMKKLGIDPVSTTNNLLNTDWGTQLKKVAMPNVPDPWTATKDIMTTKDWGNALKQSNVIQQAQKQANADQEWKEKYDKLPKWRQVIVDVMNSKAGKQATKANDISTDFLRGATDTASFGATHLLDKVLLNNLPEQERQREQAKINRANSSTAGKAGKIAGYFVPGAAEDRAAAAGVNLVMKNAPKLVKAIARGGLAGTIDMTGQELGDVAFRNESFDPENIALGAALGGAGGAALMGLASGAGAIRNVARNTASDLTERSLTATKALEDVSHESNLVTSAKNTLNDIDEQLTNLNRNAPDYEQQAASLLNDRSATVDFIRRFEPEFAPETTVRAPRSAPKTPGTRANYANQLNNGNFSPELQGAIRETDQTYKRVTNEESVNAANENLKNLTKAEADFHANESGGADHIATGYRLMQELDAMGEYDRALNVANKLAADLTKAGQTAQAASILSRLSPEGQLLNLVRTAKRSGKTVTVEDKVKFQDLAEKVQENEGAGIRENHINRILDRIESGDNVTEADMKALGDFLERAKKVVNPKEAKATEGVIRETELPEELAEPRKRDKVIQYLDNAEKKALERIATRRNRLSANPLDEWADHAIVVASQITKGAIKAATYVEDMVRLFGEEIRPHAKQIYTRAVELVNGVAKPAARGRLDEAEKVLERISGASAEKQIVNEMADHVRKLLDSAKRGEISPEDINKLRDYADEVASVLKPRKVQTPEQRFLMSVKSLAKKLAQVEEGKVPPDQANREVSSLVRQVVKLSGKDTTKALEPIDSKAISDIAHDVLEIPRPSPKPKTLEEKLVEKYIKENKVSEGDISTLRQLAKQVSELSRDDAQQASMRMQQILNKYEKSSLWDKVQAIRYISMLLNTSTQAINAASGPIMATTGYIADVFGTMIDVVLSKAFKQPRTTTLYGSNPLAFTARWLKGLKTGAKAGWMGVSPNGITGANDIRGLTYKSLYNPLGIAERTLGAVAKGPDYAAYSAVYKSELRKMGFLDAKNKGIKGRENIKRHIAEFVNDPPPEAIQQADRIGKNTTFQRSDTLGGKMANYLTSQQGKAKVIKPIAGTIFPFVRTPVNIASTAVTMTPGGLIKGLFQLTSKSDASRREAIRTLSLGLTGTGLSALGYYLSQIGIITSDNDSGNKDLDALREQQGQGKYRFNTSGLMRYMKAMLNGEGPAAAEKAAKYQEGDKQFDYNKLQPLAFPLSIGAGLEKHKGEDIEQQLSGAGTSAYGSLYGMSTLKGVQDVFQPSYGGSMGEKALGVPSRIAESFLKSFSPGLLAQEAKRQDPYQRKVGYNNGIVQDTVDYFKSRTPGLSQSLPINKTTLGQDKLNNTGIKGTYLNPYNSYNAPFNQAAVIIGDLIDKIGDESLAPKAPEKNVEGKDKITGAKVTITIPPKRYEQLQADVGNEIIRRILALPNTLSDEKKAERIKKIYSDVNEKERNKIKRELGIRVAR